MSDKIIEMVTKEEKTNLDKSNMLAEKTLDYFFGLIKEKPEVIVGAMQSINVNLILNLKDYIPEESKDTYIDAYLKDMEQILKEMVKKRGKK